jgi:ubiquinone/menaquinone biosynthesis C-methylase UbiE
MIDYYAARAPEYDSVYAKPELQADLRHIEAWVAAQCTGKQVLEVACGTGYWTQFIAPVASRVVALDAAAETLCIAANRIPDGNVSFVEGDAYALPVHLGPFNMAFAGFWFSHVPVQRQREFLAGLWQVLQPGASIILLDNVFVDGSSTPISEEDAHGNTFQTRSLNDGSKHRVLKNFPTQQAMVDVGASVGAKGTWHAWQYFWAVVLEPLNHR